LQSFAYNFFTSRVPGLFIAGMAIFVPNMRIIKYIFSMKCPISEITRPISDRILQIWPHGQQVAHPTFTCNLLCYEARSF
jgi:hypothetical protein